MPIQCMADEVETASSALKEAYALLKSDYKPLAAEFAKVYGLYFLVYIVGFGATVGIGALGVIGLLQMGDFMANLALWVVLGIALLALFLVLSIAVLAISAVPSIVHGWAKGAKTDVVAKAAGLLGPMAGYCAIMLLFGLAMLLPAILVFAVLFGIAGGGGAAAESLWTGAMFGIFGAIAMLMVISIVWLLVTFFIQFAIPEMVINGAGAFDALKRSYRLVAGNMAATFVFDVVIVIITMAISMVFGVFNQLAQVMFALGSISFAFLAAAGVLLLIVAFLQSLVIALVVTPAIYIFWKKIGGIGAS